MGVSGAGKTTLLDVLARRNKEGQVLGEVYLDGTQSDVATGYVMQDDAFIETLTVAETLYYQLSLRRSCFSEEEKESLIDSILFTLNLAKVKHTRIGSPLSRGISGGERKRLAIGMELATHPSLLFLDEPTSGLDSQNALRIMRAMKRLTESGHTAVCTIHQPRSNIFHMFDYLLLVNEGQVIYFGPVSRVLEYFNERGLNCPAFINPADFILDVLDKEEEMETTGIIERRDGCVTTDELPASFQQSDENRQLQKDLQKTPHEANQNLLIQRHSDEYPVSWLAQYRYLVARTWLATVRDTGVMYIRTAAALGIGALVGGIFFQQPNDPSSSGARINTMLFLMCVFSLFCLPAISRFINDRLLFNREKASGTYCTSAYFLSSFTVEFPILLLIVLGYGCISYWMVGLDASITHFVYFLAIIFAVIQVGFSISQCISAAVNSVTMAIAIYMIILVYSLLMGGFIVNKSALPSSISWAVYTSYFWFGFSGLCVNEFESKSYGHLVLQDMGMADVNKYVSLGCVILMWIGLQILAFLLLLFLNKEKR